MEWEVMFLCNSLGVALLFLIAMTNVVGVEAEQNAKVLEFKWKPKKNMWFDRK